MKTKLTKYLKGTAKVLEELSIFFKMTDENIKLSVLRKKFPKGFKSRKGTDYLNQAISYGNEGGEKYYYVPLNLSEEDRMLRIKKIEILEKL